MNRLIPALAILLLAAQAQAADLTVPDGTVLCHTADAAVRTDHAGCWRAQGGQRVEIIAASDGITELYLLSTSGNEAIAAWTDWAWWTARADADRIQRGKP